MYDAEDGVFISKRGELWRCVFDRRGLVGLHRWFPQPEPALATYSAPYPADIAEMLGGTLARHRVAP